MFGKERFVKRKTFFLLIMNCSQNVWDIPEETLWLSFDEAFEAATKAVEKSVENIDWSELEIEEDSDTAFMPECFEIMPISISEPNRITWLGKERKRNELHA